MHGMYSRIKRLVTKLTLDLQLPKLTKRLKEQYYVFKIGRDRTKKTLINKILDLENISHDVNNLLTPQAGYTP